MEPTIVPRPAHGHIRSLVQKSMKPDVYNEIFETALKERLPNLSPDELESEETLNKLSQSIPELADELVAHIRKRLDRSTRRMLREHSRIRKRFERRHNRQWKEGLALLETYLVAAYELGSGFNEHYRSEAAESRDYQFDALTRLHARAIQIGNEILCLLRSGYADGAHARWRTAHELSAVARFLAASTQRTSEKYLKHEVIESFRAMTQYQKYCEQLGLEPATDDEVLELKQLRDELCEFYGKAFGGDYGWAAEELGNQKPTFANLEEAAGLSHMRPYYKMASHNIHANPKGIKFKLGLFGDQELLLTGASNYGLADPAHGLATSVLQITSDLLQTRPNLDSIVMTKLLEGYADDIGNAFLSVQKSIEQSEL